MLMINWWFTDPVTVIALMRKSIPACLNTVNESTWSFLITGAEMAKNTNYFQYHVESQTASDSIKLSPVFTSRGEV